MTKGEIIVIAAAAAVFIIVNIIMWSIIAKKEGKHRKDTRPDGKMKPVRLSDTSAAAAAAGFELMENTVIVHTDEYIGD